MKKLLILLVDVLVFSVSAQADIYKCTDTAGNLIFTYQPQDPRCQVEVKQKPPSQRTNEIHKSNPGIEKPRESPKLTNKQVINKSQDLEEDQERKRQNEIEKQKMIHEDERELEERERKANNILTHLGSNTQIQELILLAEKIVRTKDDCKTEDCNKAEDIAEQAIREYNLPIHQRFTMLRHAKMLKGF